MRRSRENRYWYSAGLLGDATGALGVLSEWRSRKGSEEGKAEEFKLGKARGFEEGLKEGRAEALRAWEEWNLRRVEAEGAGRKFTEPPPSRRNGE